MLAKLRAAAESPAKSFFGEHPPWKAKTIWVAIGLILIGGGLWINNRSQAEESSAAARTGAMEFSASRASGIPVGEQREMRPAAPATFRFGASYLGGFFLGWTFRRFLKLAVLMSGAVIVLIALGKKFGWFELDWVEVENHVRHSLAWLQGEAGAFRQFVTGYLPSAGAAGIGVFLGFRRK